MPTYKKWVIIGVICSASFAVTCCSSMVVRESAVQRTAAQRIDPSETRRQRTRVSSQTLVCPRRSPRWDCPCLSSDSGSRRVSRARSDTAATPIDVGSSSVVMGPLSEFFGRSPIYILSYILFIVSAQTIQVNLAD